jgi:hypothetical protein
MHKQIEEKFPVLCPTINYKVISMHPQHHGQIAKNAF